VTPAALADLLRDCLAAGGLEPLGEAYAGDVVLDLSLPGARRKLRGPGPAVAALGACFAGPGRLVEWTPAVHPEGVAAWVERVDADGEALRQRHYLRLRAGLVARHWVYTARPHGAPAAAVPEPAEELFAELGPVAERTTLVSGGWSGNRIDRLVLADGRALIAKRIVPGSDWLGRTTRDPGREALLHVDGTFARMPARVDPATVATAREGDAWWVVMRDVSGELLDHSTPLTREQNRFVLGAAAAMWEQFWDDAPGSASTLADRLGIASLAVAERERQGLDLLPKQFDAAWEAFAEAVAPDVAEPVLDLLAEPARLGTALEERGSTLIHGDLRDENVGLADGRLVLLDWGLATRGHPAAELAWYMCHDVWRIEADHDEVVADYRAALGERDDPLALELGLISGLVQYGWIFGHSAVVHTDPAEREWARRELDWWVPRVRRALDEWR
jgi:aminoglycoside phosphotransferase (APT) family kinase protein